MLPKIKWLLGLGLILVSVPALAQPVLLDGVIAVVNDGIITKSELTQQVKLIEQQWRKNQMALPEGDLLEKQVLDHLILNEIQLQMAKKTGIHIDEIALDNAIDGMAKRNQMTVTELRQALDKEGIEFEHYRSDVRHQMILSQLQQRDVMSDIRVSDQEINQFLQSPEGPGGALSNEYRLGHILVDLPESPAPEEITRALEKAQKIVTALRAGSDFTQMAFQEGSGEQALSGGDLGWRKLPEIPTVFVKAVTTLNANDVPDPIRSGSGFHVIKLLDKRSLAKAPAVEKTLVRHILIKTNSILSDTDAKNRLLELRNKIVKGEDFAQLAKTHSADLASANNGGTLGWVTKEVLVPEFSNEMEKLAEKEMSEPFKTPFGWHILQVLERKTQTNDETALKQKAREMIQQRKFEEKLETWVRQLRDEAFVKTIYES